MTREEAIAYGKDYYRDLITACCEIDEKHKEFVRMAIQALSQEPCDDAISREDAIKAQCEACDICGNMRYTKCQYFMQGCNEVKCLRDLPPVTPSRHVNCEIAEHDGNGCLGYSHYGDDFPIKECLHCPKYTSYEEE